MLFILVVLIAAGVIFLIKSFRFRRRIDQHIKAKQIDMAVDLSSPGKFSGDFRQTWRASHGQVINLRIPADLSGQVSPSVLLESLEFECQITDANGKIMVDSNSAGIIILIVFIIKRKKLKQITMA